MNLVCIKCPRGCLLTVTQDSVTGNVCPKGIDYAREELVCPMRTVTSLVRVGDSVVPVKTSKDIPKEKINDVLFEISKVKLTSSYIGMVVIKNVLNLNCDVVVTGNKN